MCFPVNFAKFLKTPFLQNTSERLLLMIIKPATIIKEYAEPFVKEQLQVTWGDVCEEMYCLMTCKYRLFFIVKFKFRGLKIQYHMERYWQFIYRFNDCSLLNLKYNLMSQLIQGFSEAHNVSINQIKQLLLYLLNAKLLLNMAR